MVMKHMKIFIILIGLLATLATIGDFLSVNRQQSKAKTLRVGQSWQKALTIGQDKRTPFAHMNIIALDSNDVQYVTNGSDTFVCNRFEFINNSNIIKE